MLVMEHGMAMAEGSTFNILPCQANGRSICKDRGKSQRLCLPPVDTTLWAKRCRATLQQAGQFSIGSKAFGPGQQFIVKLQQLFSRNGGRFLQLLITSISLVAIRLLIRLVEIAISLEVGLLHR